MENRITAYAKLIKEYRERQNMSQEEFANRCGHKSDNARSWASKLESGRIKLSVDDAPVVADALGISPVDLIYTPTDNGESTLKISLSAEDRQMIKDIQKLSVRGREKVRERIDELLKLEDKK